MREIWAAGQNSVIVETIGALNASHLHKSGCCSQQSLQTSFGAGMSCLDFSIVLRKSPVILL
jgi:hypothetical protein